MNHESLDQWGDLLKRKRKKTTRILIHNTGGIGFISGQRSRETLKMERLKRLVINYNVDLVCLSEVNKDWRSVQQEHTIWNGTSSWCENRRVQVSYNSTKPSRGTHLVGGTAMIAFNVVVFHICQQGADKRKLGRWSFVTINGKN